VEFIRARHHQGTHLGNADPDIATVAEANIGDLRRNPKAIYSRERLLVPTA